MTSPVSLCLIHHAAQTWAFSRGNIFEDYDQPCMIGPPDTTIEIKPAPRHLRPFVTVRDAMMHILGWSPLPAQVTEPSITTIPPKAERKTAYRITTLSCLPTDFLARRIHELVWYAALLPLETILFRSVVDAFARSPLASRAEPSSLIRLPITSTWGLLSKVGLGIAIQGAADMAIWSGLYGFVRRMGTNRFHWGMT